MFDHYPTCLGTKSFTMEGASVSPGCSMSSSFRYAAISKPYASSLESRDSKIQNRNTCL